MKTAVIQVTMSAVGASPKLTRAFWSTLFFSTGYLAGGLGCLWQWDAPRPWSRLDVFSGGFLALTVLWIAGTMLLHSSFFRCPEVVQEVSGKNFDPNMLIWITALSLTDMVIFLEYGHWHLVPRLEQPAQQGLGLALFLAGGLLLFWADTYLSRHFARDPNERRVVSEGPFRFVRHPRYASLLVGRIAYALVFASIAGWLLAVVWLVVILHRVHLEEAHLRRIFGTDYDAYAARTARLFPGIY